jgi:VIT1/CCC1 family predicted Fe2+/Mn2+ transporter
MKNKLFITSLLILSLGGCAAGMANVHRSNVDIYTNLLLELGSKSEDSADETRKREIYLEKLSKGLQGLEEVSPSEAQTKRESVERILETKV